MEATLMQEQSGELTISERIYPVGEQGFLEKFQVRVGGVKKQLRKLKQDKAPGPENVHPRVLREVAQWISVILTDIFNSALESGQVPET